MENSDLDKTLADYIKKIGEFLNEGIHEAIRQEMLTVVPHGYCFYCDTEKEVLEVTDPDSPVQPPICHRCLVSKGLIEYSNPDNLKRAINGFKRPE